MSIQPETIGGRWLTDQGELHLVMAQIAPPQQDEIRNPTRPSVVSTIRALLGDDARLTRLVSGEKPSVVILPELAVGFSDWAEIDNLVRQWDRPLILIAGFGIAEGSQLTAWQNQDGPTRCIPTWTNVAPDRPYNGGWCWIHTAATRTTCIGFLKTTAEQTHEVLIDGLDQGDRILAVHLDDLVIFPVICSDFLSETRGQRVVLRKIEGHLSDDPVSDKKVLVVGLLLQPSPSPRWRDAIQDFALSINRERVNLCLVNSAQEFCCFREEEDRWRTYSGVYIPSARRPRMQHFPSVRRFRTERLDGAVIRVTAASVVGGPMRWQFEGATGRHMWLAQKSYSIGDDGSLREHACPDKFHFEASRIVKRVMLETGALEGSETKRQAYETVEEYFDSSAPPGREAIFQKLLYGDFQTSRHDNLTDALPEYLPQLKPGLLALGALRRVPGIDWQLSAEERGQLQLPGTGTSILVWYYPGSAMGIQQTIRGWESGPHSGPLIAYTKSADLGCPAPDAISSRRNDIGAAPAPFGRHADQPGQKPRISHRSLDEILTFLESINDMARVAEFSETLKQHVNALNLAEGAHGI